MLKMLKPTKRVHPKSPEAIGKPVKPDMVYNLFGDIVYNSPPRHKPE